MTRSLAPVSRRGTLSPLGTFNHSARDAGLPLDVADASSIIRQGVTRTVDVGEH